MRKLTVNTYIGYITKVPKNRKTGVYEKQNHRFKTNIPVKFSSYNYCVALEIPSG
jgi:hypothetical protein